MEIAMAVLKFVGGIIPLVGELLKAVMQVHYSAIIYKNHHTLIRKKEEEIIWQSQWQF